MSIASIETRRLLKVENRLRCRAQTKVIGLEESDEHVLLGDLIRFVENSDKSIPQIAELMGVSGVALSMWIAGTAKPPLASYSRSKDFFESTAPRSAPSESFTKSTGGSPGAVTVAQRYSWKYPRAALKTKRPAMIAPSNYLPRTTPREQSQPPTIHESGAQNLVGPA